MKYIAVFVIGGFFSLLFIALVASIFSWDAPDYDEYGLHYTGGPLDGKEFVKVIQPGSGGQFLGPFDQMETLPANQRTYIVSEDNDGDGGNLITATDKDGVELKFATSSTFELDSRPEMLNGMFINICTKYSDCDELGWPRMLNDYYRKAQESAIRQVAREYTVDQLMTEDLNDFQSKVAKLTQEKVVANMGDEYLTDITFQIQRPIAPDEVQTQYNATKAAELKTNVRREEVEQAEQQADAAQKFSETLKNNPGYLELREIQMLEECVDTPGCQLPAVLGNSSTGTNINVDR